ncbi:MAG TPA: ferritin-like domain-containing protein [Sphingomicrobium sp.]|nr:ferritin-like domain-containing protein [Sphingomicrobium sp.]
MNAPDPVTDGDTNKSRRTFLSLGSAEAAVATFSAIAASAAAPIGAAAEAQSLSVGDTDILNFALNLEYLEAEYYLRGVVGLTLDQALRGNFGGTVRGGRKVTFSNPLHDGIMRNITEDEMHHVAFLHSANGSAAVPRPPIDFDAGFAAVGQAAGLPGFDPFANELNFFLGAFLFEDVGVTAYKGSARNIRNKQILESAAGILASEGYHAGSIRTVIYKMGGAWRQGAAAISNTRDQLDGPQDLDQPVDTVGPMSNVVPSNYNGIAYGRTPQHVLNIVYGNPAAGIMQGGFFPEGLNGRIRST